MVVSVIFLFSFNPSQAPEIGTVLAIGGILYTILAVIVFPPLQRKVGTTPIYRFGMLLQCVVVLLFPIVHAVAVWEVGVQEKDVGASTVFSNDASSSGRIWTKLGIAVFMIAWCSSGVVFA